MQVGKGTLSSLMMSHPLLHHTVPSSAHQGGEPQTLFSHPTAELTPTASLFWTDLTLPGSQQKHTWQAQPISPFGQGCFFFSLLARSRAFIYKLPNQPDHKVQEGAMVGEQQAGPHLCSCRFSFSFLLHPALSWFPIRRWEYTTLDAALTKYIMPYVNI